jgi:hypothetical protein
MAVSEKAFETKLNTYLSKILSLELGIHYIPKESDEYDNTNLNKPPQHIFFTPFTPRPTRLGVPCSTYLK